MPVANRRRFTENIRRQAGRLEQMIRSCSRSPKSSRSSACRCANRSRCGRCSNSSSTISSRARQRGVNLAIDAHDAADPAVVEGDPFLLRQALGNLLDNALDFAPQGSTIRIALERQPAGKAHVAVVRVADDGPGVPTTHWRACSSASIRCRAPTARIAARALGCVSSARSRCCTAARSRSRTATKAARARRSRCRRRAELPSTSRSTHLRFTPASIALHRGGSC